MGCEDDADTTLYLVRGGGHTWPSAVAPAGLGQVNRDIDAADVIWDFFEDHLRAAETTASSG